VKDYAVLTVKELASYLKVSRSTVDRLLKARKLPAFRIGSHWRFRVEEIDSWLLKRRKTPSARLVNSAQSSLRPVLNRPDEASEEIANLLRISTMALRTCRVTCCDIHGVEHAVEVTAESLYEAVARGLAALRDTDWVGDIGRGQATIRVVVKPPEVEHTVRMRDFEEWLEANGRSPAEMAVKSRLRELLNK
jgi:excisionase family DNA binding protein